MKIIIALLLTALVVASAMEDKEKYMMKKWAMSKAFESCFGAHNFKKYMVMKKKAIAKCSGIDAPELDLPFFKAPYRVVSGLMQGASQSNNGWMEEVMKKFMFDQMMKKFANHHKHHEHGDDHDHDDDDMPFFRSGGMFRKRYRRASEDESEDNALDLGDRLITSLQGQKEKFANKIGNKTCVCRAMGVIDEDNNLDLESMLAVMDEFDMDPWLDERIREDKTKCYEFAQALPQSFLEGCILPPKLTKLKMFHKCLKMSKTWTCMNFDMRQKLEANFGSIAELTKSTGLKEEELYPLTMTLMMGGGM